MTSRFLLRSLSIAALLSVGVSAAAAQSSNVTSAGLSQWEARPTGTYRLEIAGPRRINKVDLTISDSSGALAASFHPVGDPQGHAMTVRVQGTDMILEAYTPRGLFEIVLERNADLISGHWSLGQNKGSLQGRVSENDSATP